MMNGTCSALVLPYCAGSAVDALGKQGKGESIDAGVSSAVLSTALEE